MRSFATALLVAGALVSQTAATIYVTEPTASTICTAGTPCNVRWNDDANAPALGLIGPCNIQLCTGGPQQQTCLQTISPTLDVSTNAYVTYLPDATIGPNGGPYFVKFISLNYKDPANPAVPYTSYSAMFNLNGMTGTFNSTVQAQISGVASAAAATTPAAAAGTTTTAAAAKTTAAGSASAAKASASATAAANGAISATAPGVVSSTIGVGMVMSFASFFLGALAFGL